MATTAKTTARKRKPTTRQVKKTAPVAATPVQPEYPLPESEEQRQALVDSYWTLKSSGIDIPDPIRIPVEHWIAEIQRQSSAADTTREEMEAKRIADLNMHGPTYVRNRTNNPFHFRLERQSEGLNRQRRIELKPRGVPGDIHPLKEEDLQDPILITNLQIGLIELIPAGEAQLIIEGQTHNMGVRVHPAMAIIDKEYDAMTKNGSHIQHPTLKVEAEYNGAGVTVATVDPRVTSGQIEDRQYRADGGLHRTTEPIRSTYVPTGGNPASIGIGPSAAEIQRDQIARQRGGQGPAAGLGNISVTVAPAQRT